MAAGAAIIFEMFRPMVSGTCRRRAIPFLTLGLAAALVAAGCSSGSSEAADAPEPEIVTVIEVPAGEIVIQSAGPAASLSPEVTDALLDAVETYVTDGVVATLRDGEPGDLSGVFDPAALATLDTPEGAALLDRGAPAVTGDLRAIAEPVTLTALVDESGTAVLISAALVLVVEATTDGGDVTITRVADLTFAPTADGWLVTTYKASVFRVPDEEPAPDAPTDGGSVEADATTDAGGDAP